MCDAHPARLPDCRLHVYWVVCLVDCFHAITTGRGASTKPTGTGNATTGNGTATTIVTGGGGGWWGGEEEEPRADEEEEPRAVDEADLGFADDEAGDGPWDHGFDDL